MRGIERRSILYFCIKKRRVAFPSLFPTSRLPRSKSESRSHLLSLPIEYSLLNSKKPNVTHYHANNCKQCWIACGY